MTQFNVLTEPWIPAVDRAGHEREYGLLDLLKNAHTLRAIVDPAPPIQFGLYRILITFVQAAFDIVELEDLEDVLDNDAFSMTQAEKYIARVGRNRFDLFDSEQPFLQSQPIPGDTDKPKSVVELFYHMPTGTNVTHFFHMNSADHAVSPAVVARALCSISPFMTAGGAGYSPSINGTPPLYVLALGDNLFETILYNCCAMDISSLAHKVPPAWERDSVLEPRVEKISASLAEGYTWHPRQVRLFKSEGGRCTYTGSHSPLLVREMAWGPGHKFGGQETWTDPNVAYQHDEKRGRLPIRPRDGRQVWRDYGPLFLLRRNGSSTPIFSRPVIVDQLSLLKDEGIVPEQQAEQFEVYSMRVDKAKVFEWQYERLPLRTTILENPEAGDQVQHALKLAEQIATGLYRALKRQYPRDGGGNSKALDRLIQLAQMQFWETLRGYFESVYLVQLEKVKLGDQAARQELLSDWKRSLRSIGWICFNETTRAIETGAVALQRQVAARDSFAKSLSIALGKAE